jgi:hypothetical protein
MPSSFLCFFLKVIWLLRNLFLSAVLIYYEIWEKKCSFKALCGALRREVGRMFNLMLGLASPGVREGQLMVCYQTFVLWRIQLLENYRTFSCCFSLQGYGLQSRLSSLNWYRPYWLAFNANDSCLLVILMHRSCTSYYFYNDYYFWECTWFFKFYTLVSYPHK